MLGFLGGLLRVIVGFLLACLAAGAVKVLFAVTPAELIDAGTEYWQQGGVWALYSGTMIAIFAAPFALLSAIFSEWQGIRSFAYHGFIGIAIAVAGFALIATGESPDAPSIINSYAMAAFLTTGLVSGFVYWLFAGRFAYRRRSPKDADQSGRTSAASTSPGPPGRADRSSGSAEQAARSSQPPSVPRTNGDVTRPGAEAAPQLSTGTVPATKPNNPGGTFDA